MDRRGPRPQSASLSYEVKLFLVTLVVFSISVGLQYLGGGILNDAPIAVAIFAGWMLLSGGIYLLLKSIYLLSNLNRRLGLRSTSGGKQAYVVSMAFIGALLALITVYPFKFDNVWVDFFTFMQYITIGLFDGAAGLIVVGGFLIIGLLLMIAFVYMVIEQIYLWLKSLRNDDGLVNEYQIK